VDPGSAAHHAAKGGALRSIRGTIGAAAPPIRADLVQERGELENRNTRDLEFRLLLRKDAADGQRRRASHD
jgi:hypothetical protein